VKATHISLIAVNSVQLTTALCHLYVLATLMRNEYLYKYAVDKTITDIRLKSLSLITKFTD